MDKNVIDFNQYKKHNRRKKKTAAHPKAKKISHRIKRKSVPTTPAVFALVIIVSVLYGYHRYSESGSESAYIPGSILPAITGNCVIYNTAANPAGMDDVYVLYAALNDADKCVYDLFFDLVKNKNTDNYTSAVVVSEMTDLELETDHFFNVYYAMLYDHPEFFFLLTERNPIDCIIYSQDGYKTYLFSMKKTDGSEDRLVDEFEWAAAAFLRDIDTTAPPKDIELAIHDKLLETVVYDHDIVDSVSISDRNWNLGYTAYGALVADSEGRKNHAVCGGYAFAFEYLMQRAGIPCAYISGSANSIPPSDKDTSSHAWNVVKIDGRWYEVDVTWDDCDDDEILSLLKQDEDKFFNWQHHYFNRTTAEMEYLPATEDTLFIIEGIKPYNPEYDTTHVRDGHDRDNTDDSDAFLNALIPIAE